MLFDKAPHRDVNDYDIDVLVAMAKHGSRNQDIRTWQMITLLDVQGSLIIAKTPTTTEGSLFPADEVLGYMGKEAASQLAAMKSGVDMAINPSMKKYVMGIGVMYQATMVKEGDPGADALLQEAEVMGSVTVTEPLEGHLPTHHLMMRHLNGLFYSHWLPMEGDWEMESGQVRIDTKDKAASFGLIGEGLNAVVDVLEYLSDRKVEARCG